MRDRIAARQVPVKDVLARRLGGPLQLLDVGARGGIDPRWKPFHPYLEVFGFEPDEAECERLNTEAAGRSYRSRFFPYALGRDGVEVPFHVCRWPVASSVFQPNAEFLRDFPIAAALMAVVARRMLRTVGLDQVCLRENLVPDVLKVDVEGAELDVLRDGESVLRTVLLLDIEVEFAELFAGQPLFADVDSFLRERGWQLLGLRRVSWRRPGDQSHAMSALGGQIVAGDALYVNAATIGAGLSVGRALRLAAALSAYSQHDLVAVLLRSSPLSALDPEERASLTRYLLPDPPAWVRIARRLWRNASSDRRRALADALQPGDATAWQDAHYF